MKAARAIAAWISAIVFVGFMYLTIAFALTGQERAASDALNVAFVAAPFVMVLSAPEIWQVIKRICR